MKIFKISAFALIALALSMSSCQKNDALQNPVKKGGDLDEPIVIGTVLNSQQTPVSNAFIEAYPFGSSEVQTSTNANESGNYSISLNSSGSYYFKAYDDNTLIVTSGFIDVADTVYVDLEE